MRLRGVLLALIACACLAGCERNSEANYPARFPFSYVQRECGPTDGAALNFYFTLTQSPLGKYQEPFLEISINEKVPSSAPQDYSIKPGKYVLLASRCLSPGKCDAATSRPLAQGKELKGIVSLLHGTSWSILPAGKVSRTWQILAIPLRQFYQSAGLTPCSGALRLSQQMGRRGLYAA
jgi:hypothetical protein